MAPGATVVPSASVSVVPADETASVDAIDVDSVAC